MNKKIQILILLFLVIVLVVFQLFTFNGGLEDVLESGNFSKIPGYIIPQIKTEGSMDGLANSSWPMYGHDRQHSGLSSVIGPQSNNTKWIFQTGDLPDDEGGWTAGPPSIGVNGTIYEFAAPDLGDSFYLYSIYPNGTLKWRTNSTFTVKPDNNGATLIDSNGTIYVPDFMGKLYAFDSSNGTLKWEFSSDDKYGQTTTPNMGKDGTVYFICGDYFYAINPDGSLKWKMHPNEAVAYIYSNPAIGPDGTIYFVGVSGYSEMADYYIYAMDSKGKVKWKYNFMNCLSTGSPSVAQDGTIYLPVNLVSNSGSTYIYAFETNGKLKWTSPLSPGDAVMQGIPAPDESPFGDRQEAIEKSEPPAIGPDGTIYVPTLRYLIAIQPNGKQKWAYEFMNDQIQSPISVDKQGTAYLSGSYKTYAIMSNGTLKWQYKMGNEASSGGTPIIGPDGTAYLTSVSNRFIYAIG